MSPDKSSCINALANADSWFLTEYHFLPIVHTPWLFFFCFNFIFSLSVLMIVFSLLFFLINRISFSQILKVLLCIFSRLGVFYPDSLMILWSTSLFSFFKPLIFFLYMHQILDTTDWDQLTTFVTLICELSYMSFTILCIVLIDSSLVGIMFPFN